MPPAPAEDGLNDREVEREENVLHDDDSEDQRSLPIPEAPQLGQELGHDCRGGDRDRAANNEGLATTPPEYETERDAGHHVQREKHRTRDRKRPSARQQVVHRELEPEVEQQHHEPERGEQPELIR